MLYLGHFTFDGETPEGYSSPGEDVHGWFTTLCEAGSPEEAYNKFGDLIESLEAEGFDGFETVQSIYLEDITEVEKLPEKGVLARWHMYDGPDPQGTTSTNLPGPSEGVAAYGWGDELDEEEGEYTVAPFYVFERDGA